MCSLLGDFCQKKKSNFFLKFFWKKQFVWLHLPFQFSDCPGGCKIFFFFFILASAQEVAKKPPAPPAWTCFETCDYCFVTRGTVLWHVVLFCCRWCCFVAGGTVLWHISPSVPLCVTLFCLTFFFDSLLCVDHSPFVCDSSLSSPPTPTPKPSAHIKDTHSCMHTRVHTQTHIHTQTHTNRYEFAVFIIALYIMSIYLGKYVDKPVSEWIQERLVAAVKWGEE